MATVNSAAQTDDEEEDDLYGDMGDTSFGGLVAGDYGSASGGQSPDDPGQEAVDILSQAQKQLLQRGQQSAQAAYGQNAAQRWAGTPAVGLGIFQGFRQDRDPVINARGKVTGYSSAPGAPMAHPPDGLIGGAAIGNVQAGGKASSLTPQARWNEIFAPRPAGVTLIGGGGASLPIDRMGSSAAISTPYGRGSISNRPSGASAVPYSPVSANHPAYAY